MDFKLFLKDLPLVGLKHTFSLYRYLRKESLEMSQ
jgi:hypothetical protein